MLTKEQQDTLIKLHKLCNDTNCLEDALDMYDLIDNAEALIDILNKCINLSITTKLCTTERESIERMIYDY
jgi:hypothetical protein